MSDVRAREAIVDDLDTTMMVEAAAGTGKTSSLVRRAVALLRSGRCDVSTMAAITFTVKAAAQLRSRMQEELEKQLRTATFSDAAERARLEASVRDLDRAFVGTTHAFCARLLRERPIEAGLDPEFEEIEPMQAAVLTLDFWQRWYHARSAVGDAKVVEATAAGLTEELLRGAFVELVEFHGDVEIVSEACAKPDLAPAVDAVRTFLRTVENDLPYDSRRVEPDKFELMVCDMLRVERTRDLADPLGQLDLLLAADHETRVPIQKRWPERTRAKSYELEYGRLFASSVGPALARWREYAHCMAMDLLRPALGDYATERRQKAAVTFNDLLLLARDLLRDHPGVRRYFRRRFTHLLVDEFQDTDPLQAELLFYLTGEEAEERNWTRLTPRKGSLFIVGDPKQSIYRFRRADITTYLAVRQRIEKSGGRILQLAKNFRSSRSVCGFVNETFPSLFDGASVAEGIQAGHVDLEANYAGGARDGVYLLESPKVKAEEFAAAEAACIAAWIRSAVESKMKVADAGEEREARWSDFMLVSRIRSRLRYYAEALEREGVPFEVTGADGFGRSRWLQAALPLLRAAADPDNPVPVVSFLRGPLCGASDEDLYRFVAARGSWSPFRALPEGTPRPVADGFAILREAIEYARTLPPAAAISKTFERAGVTARAAAGEQAGSAAGNTLLALALARAESARGSAYPAIVGYLGELLEAGVDVEEMDVDPERENAVRLMNLHQVKGLEAAVVFLVDPVEGKDHEPDRHIDRAHDVSRGWFTIRRRREHSVADIALPRGWEALKAKEARFAEAEEKRLLYVAATRPKNLLVVGATLHKGIRGGRWAELAARARQPLPAREGVHLPVAASRVPNETFAGAMEAIEGRRRAALVQSYSVVPVTRIAHGTHEQLVRAEEGLGKGTSWGRVLHRLFEAMLREPSVDLRFFAGSLLKDEERDAAEIEEVMAAVTALHDSALWRRVVAADEKYAEVPFAVNVPASSLGLSFDGETLLHGTIDLVFREGNRWHIVDYKSDSTAGRLEELVSYYRPQVEHYARFWRQLTGAETVAGLFFVDGAIERWV